MATCFVWLQFAPAPLTEAPNERSTAPPKPAIGLVIIDAGHGGQDSGTMRNGVLEKDLTLDVARRVEGLARAHGFRTMLTRPNDTWVSLAARAAIANRENNCVFVSIHFDEGSRAAATGVQTFYAERSAPKVMMPSLFSFLKPILPEAPLNFESQSLAGFVQDALVTRTHAFNRGTRAERFYVVSNVRHPAVLVEGGFFSNNDDLSKLTTEDYRQELAAGITEGLVHYRDLANEREKVLAHDGAPAE